MSLTVSKCEIQNMEIIFSNNLLTVNHIRTYWKCSYSHFRVFARLLSTHFLCKIRVKLKYFRQNYQLCGNYEFFRVDENLNLLLHEVHSRFPFILSVGFSHSTTDDLSSNTILPFYFSIRLQNRISNKNENDRVQESFEYVKISYRNIFFYLMSK